jgi:hypothetical protein
MRVVDYPSPMLRTKVVASRASTEVLAWRGFTHAASPLAVASTVDYMRQRRRCVLA